MDILQVLKALTGLGKSSAKRQDELLEQINKVSKENPESFEEKAKFYISAFRSEERIRTTGMFLYIAIIGLMALVYINPGDIFTTKPSKLLKRAVENADTNNIRFSLVMHEDSSHFHIAYDTLVLGTLEDIKPNDLLRLKVTEAGFEEFRWQAVSSDPEQDIRLGMVGVQKQELALYKAEPGDPYREDTDYRFMGGSLVLKYNYLGQDTLGADETLSVRDKYKISLGERSNNQEVIWHETQIFLRHTADGDRYADPIALWHKDWSSIYVVSMAIGKYAPPDGVYRLKARAFRLRPVTAG